jgi:A nuclease family of the HNH/ENDO VII superfamily with conserved AHH
VTSFSLIKQTGSSQYRATWQRHHLIPNELAGDPAFVSFFGGIAAAGYVQDDFEHNGILLPNEVEDASASGLTLHRGSHPRYTRFVSRLFEDIRDEANARTAFLEGQGGSPSAASTQAYQEALATVRGSRSRSSSRRFRLRAMGRSRGGSRASAPTLSMMKSSGRCFLYGSGCCAETLARLCAARSRRGWRRPRTSAPGGGVS